MVMWNINQVWEPRIVTQCSPVQPALLQGKLMFGSRTGNNGTIIQKATEEMIQRPKMVWKKNQDILKPNFDYQNFIEYINDNFKFINFCVKEESDNQSYKCVEQTDEFFILNIEL